MINIELKRQNNKKLAGYGKYYPRVANQVTIGTKQLIEEISTNCTLKYSDVIAVMVELSERIDEHFRKGDIVNFAYLGKFKPKIFADGVDCPDDFTTNKIRGVKCIYSPPAKDKHKPLYQNIEFRQVK